MPGKERDDEQAEHVEDMVLACQELVDAGKRDEAIDLLLTIYVGGAMRRRLEQGGAPYPATRTGLERALRERGVCEEYHGCLLPSGHNPEFGHSRDEPPQWALDKMWTHVTAQQETCGRELSSGDSDRRVHAGVAGVWMPAEGDRVQLVKQIAALAPVGSRGVITMAWEPSVMNGVARTAQFCVDCEGWPPFVTEALNLVLVERASPSLASSPRTEIPLKGGWCAEASIDDERVWEVLHSQEKETDRDGCTVAEMSEILCEVYPTGSTAGGGPDRSAEDNAKLVAALLNKHAKEGAEPVEHNHFTTVMPFAHDCPACNPKRAGVAT